MNTIEIEDVVKRFGRTPAVQGISTALTAGVTGILGPNGAGKTTLLRMLATVLGPDAGDLRLLGRNPTRADERVEIRRRLGYLPQDPGFHPRFTAFEFVDYIAVLKEMTDRRARQAEVRRVLELVGLADVSRRRIKNLSGGMRQRLGIAQALIGSPELLLLDEPTAGLDPEHRISFRELLSSRPGATVVVSTHQTEDVAALCHQVLVIVAGRVLFEGRPRELADLASGRVWLGDERETSLTSWRTGEGRHRHIGDPPPAADLVEPTIEDGYLLLLKSTREEAAA